MHLPQGAPIGAPPSSLLGCEVGGPGLLSPDPPHVTVCPHQYPPPHPHRLPAPYPSPGGNGRWVGIPQHRGRDLQPQPQAWHAHPPPSQDLRSRRPLPRPGPWGPGQALVPMGGRVRALQLLQEVPTDGLIWPRGLQAQEESDLSGRAGKGLWVSDAWSASVCPQPPGPQCLQGARLALTPGQLWICNFRGLTLLGLPPAPPAPHKPHKCPAGVAFLPATGLGPAIAGPCHDQPGHWPSASNLPTWASLALAPHSAAPGSPPGLWLGLSTPPPATHTAPPPPHPPKPSIFPPSLHCSVSDSPCLDLSFSPCLCLAISPHYCPRLATLRHLGRPWTSPPPCLASEHLCLLGVWRRDLFLMWGSSLIIGAFPARLAHTPTRGALASGPALPLLGTCTGEI